MNAEDLESMGLLAARAAQAAGEIILADYAISTVVETKLDGSPITSTDKRSHEVLMFQLSSSGFFVVSEEGTEYGQRDRYYWLIDPLDGTKDFIARNDEFCVNIALMKDDIPILGVIFAPVFDELYLGIVGKGVEREKNGAKKICEPLPRSRTLRVAKSRFHDHDLVKLFCEQHAIEKTISIGASVKNARLVDGDVDVYPRFVGTSEWDTAAGQAILTASGGDVIDIQTGYPLKYGKPARRNGEFIAFRSPYAIEEFFNYP
jgi:3'(2'), 5'-bisphosphate nucleotidase